MQSGFKTTKNSWIRKKSAGFCTSTAFQRNQGRWRAEEKPNKVWGEGKTKSKGHRNSSNNLTQVKRHLGEAARKLRRQGGYHLRKKENVPEERDHMQVFIRDALSEKGVSRAFKKKKGNLP